ncbi:relaxase/mobilization nuclease domain-containing protein [Tenacibaculum xiamenense]|uniref:relaxase/mobilization nuclease domain-containing protein n=1 Tax=Tenacibaculum xiamenense TaxID=1261553 RepID=UPI003894FA21
MFIKELKTSNQKFSRLINYFLESYQKGDPQLFRNTGFATKPRELTKVFTENSKFKHSRSKNLRHCIMSFTPEDSEKLEANSGILYDLAGEYLRLRGYDKAMVYGVLHRPDKTKKKNESIKHYHWHFLISVNEYRSKKSTRNSRKDYEAQQVALEEYQYEKYPHLQSLVYTDPERTKTPKTKRTHKEDNKHFITKIYTQIADESISFSDFCERIEKHAELTLYTTKKGIVNGCWYKGNKYRFRTFLGVERYDILQELEQLKKLRKEKEQERGKAR